jgi:hypothetical protein
MFTIAGGPSAVGEPLSMTGLIGFAPIYLNGVLALFFALVLPGLVFVRAINISNFPQKWFVVFLSSLTANHLLVTLIAALHLDPVETYRAAAVALIAVLILAALRERAGLGLPASRSASVVLLSDIRWLVFSLIVLGVAYINVWRQGVPNIFEGGDVSYSWNAWSLIWSQGKFPASSLGYPQFVPTIWAVTYIFTGSTEQYFAFYIYLAFIVVPVVLNVINLGRVSWSQPLVSGLVLVWFIAEIREPWLKSCLPQGYPDWVAAIFGFSGAVLFVANAPEGRFDRERITAALISVWLLSIAAATKPLYGLFVIAVLTRVCIDAAKYLQPEDRKRLTIAAIGLVSAFVAAYVIDYWHLSVARAIPTYSYPLSEKLFRAVKLLNEGFALPFRFLAFAGIALSPFLPRVRWLTLPLVIGFWLWASTASYDLRNVLGLLLISAFIPLFAVARAIAPIRVPSSERRWSVPDGAVAIGLAIICFGTTLSLAQGDKDLKQRFATEQLTKGAGLQINQKIEQLLLRGCTIFNSDNYLYTISAFERFLDEDKIPFFHAGDPLTDGLLNAVSKASGCTSFFYPPDRTHPSVLSFISTISKAQNYTKVVEGNGMELLASSPVPSDPR